MMNAAVLFFSLLPLASAFVSQAGTSRRPFLLFAKPKVFIDGEAGTTGLQVYDRLSKRDDIEVLQIDPEKRKDESERKKLINEADAVILCKFVRWSVRRLVVGIPEFF